MGCAEQSRLRLEYEAVEHKHFQLKQELNARMATAPKTHYDELRKAADAAKSVADQARKTLERHVVNHGC